MRDEQQEQQTRTVVCPRCGRPLAWCSARVLVLGTVRIEESVVLVCRYCGRRRRWQPVIPQRIKNSE